MKRIYLNEILPKIRKTDIRAAIQWCIRNNVAICEDGRDKYCVYDDFVKAYNKPSKKGLKQKEELSFEKKKTSYAPRKVSNKGYNPQSDEARSFLDSID
nr:hypothetical protein [uncultured Carboxylicivirga sp.]